MSDLSHDAARYFASEVERAEGATARWVEIGEIDPILFARGLEFRPLLGENVLVNFVSYEPHTDVPRHAHAEEQVTFVIDGEFELECDGETRTLRRGSVVHIPPGVPHAARTHDTSCFQIDVFSPPRQVLVDAMTGKTPPA